MTKNVKKIIGFLCIVMFCTAVAVYMPQMAMAAGEVTIDETNFPDINFRNYVKAFDKNNSNGLSESEIADIKSIKIFNASSLKGIEYFTALTYLDCGSGLTELDVSNNTALTYLDCCSNDLIELDVSNNKVLEDLECANNQLTKLDLSNNLALTTLYCANNQLTELDLSNNTALTGLNCESNELTELDLSKSEGFKVLLCKSNKLIKLGLSNNKVLEELDCSDNQLTELDLSNISNTLQILNCEFNQLTKLDVSNNMILHYLRCESNQLSNLDLSDNIDLTTLYCYSNPLVEIKLNSQTYNKLLLYKANLHGDNANLSNLQNITETATNNSNTISLLKVIDITKPATYKVNGKDCTIFYTNKEILPSTSPNITSSPIPSVVPTQIPSATPIASPSSSPVIPANNHIFNHYNYTNPVTGSAVVIYGNGKTQTVDGKKVNNKALTVYTDILASYKYTPNSNGTVKASVGKVIVGITKSDIKPTLSSKNKITDTSASKIAKARIKNGQITVTAVGKEGGIVYLWVIDTGSKGVSACCPINVKLAPTKLEVQNTSGSKITKNTKLENDKTLDICVAGFVGSTKADDGTYTATVASKHQNYVSVTPVEGSTNKFKINAKGLKNNKDTKVTVTFKCDQNGKKTNLSLTITK